MTLVLVTGGTGHLGQDLVDRLVRDGHQVRIFARSRRPRADVEWAIGDLATGEGLPTALRGVHTVINAATHSPVAQRGGFRPVDFFTSPSDVDAEGTQRLAPIGAGFVPGEVDPLAVGAPAHALRVASVHLWPAHDVRDRELEWSTALRPSRRAGQLLSGDGRERDERQQGNERAAHGCLSEHR